MQTGIQGPIGQEVEAQCKLDVGAYFSRLASKIQGLGLERLAADSPDHAKETVQLAMNNLLRKERPNLFMALAVNIQKAYVTGYAMPVHVIKEAEGDLPFEPLDYLGKSGESAAEYAAQEAGDLVVGIDQTTVDKIDAAVSQGIETQAGVPGTARLIKSVTEEMATSRAETIASTEINRAFSRSAVDKLFDLGIEFKRVIPFDPCPICEENAAEGAIPTDEDFSSGDPYPPFHPNCRCTVVGARAPEAADESYVRIYEYSDEEPRDDQGRWSSEGGIQDHVAKYGEGLAGEQGTPELNAAADHLVKSGFVSPTGDDAHASLTRGLDSTRRETGRRLGTGTVTLYRGVGGTQADSQKMGEAGSKVNLKVNTLSSWTTDPGVAKIYADSEGPGFGRVIKADVPTHMVAFTSQHPAYENAIAEFGQQHEHVVISKGKVKGVIHSR